MKYKRGQAAMEFLMTYGWAILAAIIVVGVLWYIIGNPGNLAGNTFTMQPPIDGVAMSAPAAAPGVMTLEIRNGVGKSISVTELTVTGCGSYVAVPVAMTQGQKIQFDITCAGALVKGDRFVGDVAMKYTTSDSTLVQQATGSISYRIP